MFLVAFAVLSLLSYGGRACELTGQPKDVVAEVGTDAIFNCPTDTNACTATSDCKVTWYRITSSTQKKTISSCAIVYKAFKGRFSISGGPKWRLNITGVNLKDARKMYRCEIRSQSATVTSKNVSLIIPSAINITVMTNQLTEGESGDFSCLVQNARGAHFTYKWFLNRNDIEFFNDSIHMFGKDKKTVQIRNIQSGHNGANITCAAYSGSARVKTSKNVTIRVHDRRITTQPISTTNPGLVTTNRDSVIPNPSTKDHRSRAPVRTVEGDSQSHTPSIQTKQESDPGIDHPGNGNTALFAGGGVGAVFLILVIVCLIYCLVFKGRSKTRSQHPNPRNGDGRDAGAVELAETQPTKHAASESAKASTSSTGGSGSVEPRPLDSQQMQVNVHRDQVCEDTPLSVEESTPFDCGYKPRHLDPVYALVDKSRPQIGKSAAEQSSKVSPKDGPKGNGITANDAGRDEIQSGPIPGVNVAPVAAGSKPDGAPTGKKPPRVTPYHLSKSRKRTGTEAKSEPPEQTAERGGDGAAQDDPRLRNAEGLIYADLDLTRGSPRVVSSEEEETLYAGIVNKETVGNLREGSIHHAR